MSASRSLGKDVGLYASATAPSGTDTYAKIATLAVEANEVLDAFDPSGLVLQGNTVSQAVLHKETQVSDAAAATVEPLGFSCLLDNTNAVHKRLRDSAIGATVHFVIQITRGTGNNNSTIIYCEGKISSRGVVINTEGFTELTIAAETSEVIIYDQS